MVRHKAETKRSALSAAKTHERKVRLVRTLSLVIVLAVVFSLGFFVRSNTTLLTALGIPVLTDIEAAQVASSDANKTTSNSIGARLNEVEDLLNENSMDGFDLDSVTKSMLDSLAESTGDPYLAYFDPVRYSDYLSENAESSYDGIGVLFFEYNGRVLVNDVFEGSPAASKGVQQGDMIVAINGDEHKWTMAEVVNALSAVQPGEDVVIRWRHLSSPDAETGEEFSTTLSPTESNVRNVTSQLYGTVGYIKLKQITQSSADLVRQSVEDLTQQGATSFVLDIRDNPGGYLTQAVDIASLFVKSGVVVQVETTDGVTTKQASGDQVTTAPLVVLVNDYTASGAEVLAGALQDNDRATIVGETTLGKGSVQVMRELTFGGALRYTAAYYMTPLGHDIEGVGIHPDISVGMADDSRSDAQLSQALDTAEELVLE